MPDPLLALATGLAVLFLAAALFHPGSGLLAWWQRRRPASGAALRGDVLKLVLQSEVDGRTLDLEAVAARLELSQQRASELIESLQRAEMVLARGEGLRLSDAGRAEALRLIRAHRLWERHLADRTGFDEAEWHARADLEEHRLTPAQADELARSLGHPARDPHGDPIPTATGEIEPHAGIPLPTLPPGARARIMHVEDEPSEVYARLLQAGLVAGTLIRRLASNPEVVGVQVNGETILLSPAEAENLAVIALPRDDGEVQPAGRPLQALRRGDRAVVLGISPRCRGAERRRMLDLGILPGTTIEAVLTSPAGEPTAYRIRDALIALRRAQAELIRVTPEAE